MMPVTAVALLESIALLAAAADNFAARTVEGLGATERGPALVEQGLMLATALAPEIGYDAAAALAKEALKSGRTIRELALERGIAAGRARPAARPGRDDRARPGRRRAAADGTGPGRPDRGDGTPVTIAPMTATPAWDRAAALPVPAVGRRRPEIAALRAELPIGRRAVHVHARRGAAVRDPPAADRGTDLDDARRDS